MSLGKGSMNLSGSLGEEIKKKKEEEDKRSDDDYDLDEDVTEEDEEEDEDDEGKLDENRSRRLYNESKANPPAVSENPLPEEERVSESGGESSEKERQSQETGESGDEQTTVTKARKKKKRKSRSSKAEETPQPDEGNTVKYFVKQLKQVNNIIEGLLGELKKNDTKEPRTSKDKKTGDKQHQHGNVDKTPKGRHICCIVLKDKKPKPSEECLVCQLINLQDQLDKLIDKKLGDGEEEYLKELKSQRKKLKDQIQKLIEECDSSVTDDSKGDAKKPGKKGDNDPSGGKHGDGEGRGDKEGKEGDKKTAKQSEGVFLNCLNELFILVKSMNCFQSPGTLWQKSIPAPPKAQRRGPPDCCSRNYPHMHGELNGVGVVLKLFPSKKKKEVAKPKQVVEEDEDEEDEDEEEDYEDEEEEDEEELPPEPEVRAEQPLDSSKIIDLEDDVSIDSDDSDGEVEEEDERNEERDEREDSGEYAISDLQGRSQENQKQFAGTDSKDLSKESDQGSSKSKMKSSSKNRSSSFQARGSKGSRVNRGDKKSTSTQGTDFSSKRSDNVDLGYEEDEDVSPGDATSSSSRQKRPRPKVTKTKHTYTEPTLTLILDRRLGPFIFSIDIDKDKTKRNNRYHENKKNHEDLCSKEDLIIGNEGKLQSLANINNQADENSSDNHKKNINENDLIDHIKNQVTSKNFSRNYFTIGRTLHKKIYDNYLDDDDKRIIIKGLNHKDIFDSYLKNNKNCLLNIKSETDNYTNDNVCNHEPNTSSASTINKEKMFKVKSNLVEDLNKKDHFNYQENLMFNKTEENVLFSPKILNKQSNTTISICNSDSSSLISISSYASSSQAQTLPNHRNRKYKFDSLVDSVFNNSKSSTSNVIKDSNQENLKKGQKVSVEEISIESSKSSCSVTFKVVSSESKVEIDMNASHTHKVITGEINKKILLPENYNHRKQIKKEKYKLKYNQLKKCDMKKSTTDIKKSASMDGQNKAIKNTADENDSVTNNDVFEYNNNCDDNGKFCNYFDRKNDYNINLEATRETSKILPWKLKISKPEVRQLEIFLNLVNETHQFLAGNSNNDNNNNNNDNSNENNYNFKSESYKNINHKNNNEGGCSVNNNMNMNISSLKDFTDILNSSSDSYESCDDTCYADFLDAHSTSSKDGANNAILTTFSKPLLNAKDKELETLLKKEIETCNKIIELCVENIESSKLYLCGSGVYNTDFIIKVSPDDSFLEKYKKSIKDFTENDNFQKEKNIHLKFHPIDDSIISFLYQRQCGLESYLNNELRFNKPVNQQDIVCANFNTVGDDEIKYNNNASSLNNRITNNTDEIIKKSTDNKDLKKRKQRARTRGTYLRSKEYDVNDLIKEEPSFIPKMTESNTKYTTEVDYISLNNENDKLGINYEEKFKDEGSTVVWENEIEGKIKSKKPKKENKELNCLQTSMGIDKGLKARYCKKDENKNKPKKKSVSFNNEMERVINNFNYLQNEETCGSFCKPSKKFYFGSFSHSNEGIDLENNDSALSGPFQNNLIYNNNDNKGEEFTCNTILNNKSDFTFRNPEKDGNMNSMQSYANLHKGILKRSCRIDESLMDEYFPRHAFHTNTNFSDDSYDSDIPMSSRKRTHKKSVSFTMPKDHIKFDNSVVNSHKLRKNYTEFKDYNSDEKEYGSEYESDFYDSYEKIDDQILQIKEKKESNKLEKNTLNKLHHSQLHFFSFGKKYAKFLSSRYHILTKISTSKILYQTDIILRKLQLASIIKYIDTPHFYGLESYKTLNPMKLSSSLGRIKKISKNYQADVERKGFIVKLGIYHVFQYHSPICMNLRSPKNQIKYKKITSDEREDTITNEGNKILQNNKKKLILRKMLIRSSTILKKKPSVLNEDFSKNLVSYVTAPGHAYNSEDEAVSNSEEFLDYLHDIRNSVMKTDYKIDGKYFDIDNSKIVFDCSARPDAILSITAHDDFMRHQNQEHVPEIKSNMVKLFPYESNGRLLSTNYNIRNENDGDDDIDDRKSNHSDEIVSNEPIYENKLNRKSMQQVGKLQFLPNVSTINIKVGDVLRNEPIVNRPNVKIVGRIIEPKIKNPFVSENLPLCYPETDDRDETLSSETYSVNPKIGCDFIKDECKTTNPNICKLNKIQNQFKLKQKPKEVTEDTIMNKRKNILLTKNNYTKPCPFNFYSNRKEFQTANNRNESLHIQDTNSRRCKSCTYERKIGSREKTTKEKSFFPKTTNTFGWESKVFKRPHSCQEPREINITNTESKLACDKKLDKNADENKKSSQHSKSLNSLNLQNRGETNDGIQEEVMCGTKESSLQLLIDKEKMEVALEEETSIIESYKNSNSEENIAVKYNSSETSLLSIKTQTGIKSSQSNSSESYTSHNEEPNLVTMACERKRSKGNEENNDLENTYNLNSTGLSCDMDEDDTNKKNAASLELMSDACIEDIETKIINTFPDTATIKSNLLKKVSQLQSNIERKQLFSESQNNKVDCFGAPLQDDLGILFYNKYGKPVVNIYGCKIYDKDGIPKRGAYGKPIHSALRAKLNAALQNIQVSNNLLVKNENFEEDLLKVLQKFSGLKTDLYGRVYDSYGRPLFDSFGYLQYDSNGNPLTDAFNRNLHDKKGKPLISQTICNSTIFKGVPPVGVNVKKKFQLNNGNIEKAIPFESISKSEIAINKSSTPTNAKKQVSFDENIVLCEKKEDFIYNMSNAYSSIDVKDESGICNL